MLLGQICVFVATMVATTIFVITMYIVTPSTVQADEPCIGGHICPDSRVCCDHGCCVAATQPKIFFNETHKEHTSGLPWYAKWPALFIVWGLLGILIGIFLVRCFTYIYEMRHCSCTLSCCVPRSASDLNSTGSCYPPPQYSRCGSFHQAPPLYSEVTSKPDLYPLVIPCGEGENKNSGNYLMVHYFRNYVFRPPGSISATSTAESLNSSIICNATNETNSVIPPPYSCASNYEEWRGGGDSDHDGRPVLHSVSPLTEPHSPPPLFRARTISPEPRLRRSFQDLSPDDAIRHTFLNSPVRPTVNRRYDLHLKLMDYELSCDGGGRPRKRPTNSDDFKAHFKQGFEHPTVGQSPTNSDDFKAYLKQGFEHPTVGQSPTNSDDFKAYLKQDLELPGVDQSPTNADDFLRVGQSPTHPDHLDADLDQDLEREIHFYRCRTPGAPCKSPPQATSPTQTSTYLTLRSEERRHRRLESIKKYSKLRKSSLYMPLSTNSNGTSRTSPSRMFIYPRSAPVTPCNPFVPNILSFSQRLTGSRYNSKSSKLGGEESNPLIFPDEDYKF